MKTKGKAFFQVLLNRYHRGPVEEIYQMLPEEEAEDLRALSIASSDIHPGIAQAKEQLTHFHYSWLVSYVKQLSETHQKLVVASLPMPIAKKIAEVMQLELPESPLTPHMQSFFLDKFYKKILPEEVLPAAYTLETPLYPLLALDKKRLITLIDLFGVYDFAESIRKIVDKRQLKSLTNCLSPTQQKFLRHCLQIKEKLSAKKTVLEKWDKDPKKLRKNLHRRGLMRLGITISQEKKDFLWHLTHTLDTGRATLLEKCYQQQQSTHIVEALTQQLLKLLNFLEKKNP